MQPLRWERRPDGLRAPALVCAFKGWNDAGESATAALTFLGEALEAERFATIDPEEFVDFQATRPTVRLRDGLTRHIDWPEFEVYEARIPRAPRDLILLSGPEPAIRWRTFCQTVIDLSEALGVQMVTSLGALLADVPHSRPVSVTGIASDESLVERLGMSASRYEGPTGIVGCLQAAASDAGLPAASLWAAVPHYVAVVPNPKGALARRRDGPGRAGVRRAPRARRGRGGAVARSVADPLGRPAGARVPALPAPSRRRPALGRRPPAQRRQRSAAGQAMR